MIGTVATAQKSAPTSSELLPKFENYPVTDIFKGPPAPPKLRRPGDRLFRTRIREGAAKGPNFAGHFTVAEWGCGAGCVSIAIVDAKDGRIYDAPFTALAWGVPMMKDSVEPTLGNRRESTEFSAGRRSLMKYILIMHGKPGNGIGPHRVRTSPILAHGPQGSIEG
jgi:hypothetical protein